jgi:ATP/ADP translocase
MTEDLSWLQPVIVGAVIVFIIDLIGNTISFSNRFLNALATAIVFFIIFGALFYSGAVKFDMKTLDEPASTSAPSTTSPSTTPETPPATTTP